MPKQKVKKSVKNNKKASSGKEKKLIAAISVLVSLLVLVLIYCCFSMKGLLISHEERRRLEAFESLAYAYIQESPIAGDETDASTQITGIGLSKDDDLYLDFIIYYYDDNSYGGFLATEYQNGRLHFQCNKEYSRPVTVKGSGHCAFAYSYGEKTAIDNPPEYFGIDADEIKEQMKYVKTIGE